MIFLTINTSYINIGLMVAYGNRFRYHVEKIMFALQSQLLLEKWKNEGYLDFVSQFIIQDYFLNS